MKWTMTTEIVGFLSILRVWCEWNVVDIGVRFAVSARSISTKLLLLGLMPLLESSTKIQWVLIKQGMHSPPTETGSMRPHYIPSIQNIICASPQKA